MPETFYRNQPEYKAAARKRFRAQWIRTFVINSFLPVLLAFWAGWAWALYLHRP